MNRLLNAIMKLCLLYGIHQGLESLSHSQEKEATAKDKRQRVKRKGNVILKGPVRMSVPLECRRWQPVKG